MVTYGFEKRYGKELKKLTKTQKRKFSKFANMRGIGEYTALEAAKGNKFALGQIKKKRR